MTHESWGAIPLPDSAYNWWGAIPVTANGHWFGAMWIEDPPLDLGILLDESILVVS